MQVLEEANADHSQDIALSVKDLSVEIRTKGRVLHAVRNVSFDLHKGETLAIVGESGCGKSLTALSLMGLLPARISKITSGSIQFSGTNLVSLEEKRLRSLRGRSMAMIFQEPMTSLNPVLSVGYQICEVLRRHFPMSRKVAFERAIELLELVRIPEPRLRAAEYPHQLSGGMRQRVVIAIALACEPEVLICDEPTTALDVTVQAQILELLRELRDRTDTAMILITHDFGVVAETADRVMVMYAGRSAERAEVAELFERPSHPYTAGLMRAVPTLRRGEMAYSEAARLIELPGQVPALDQKLPGCAFADRCSRVEPRCREGVPKAIRVSKNHHAACWYAQDVYKEGSL